MKVTALAPWFGGKRTLAPQIVAAIGPHRTYFEPFCGSMAVLLAKPACTMEVVNDLHGDLVNLARTIQSPTEGPKLYRALRRVVLARDLFEESAEVIRKAAFEPTTRRAFDYFVVSWFGRNGVAGTSSYNAGFCARYTSNGGHSAKRFCSAVESIPQWRRRLREVTILSDDAFGLIGRIEDKAGTAIYCDPPYLVKGAKYTHDFADADHGRLAEALSRFRRTRVVVSYYAHPRLAELYPGWRLIECPTAKAMVNQGKRDSGGKTVAPEVLLVNDASSGGLF